MDVGLVCDSCSTFNPMGATACSACGAELSLDSGGVAGDASNGGTSGAAVAAAGDACPACGAAIPPGFRFCGACGKPLEAPAAGASPPVAAPPRAEAAPRSMAAGGGSTPAPRAGVGKKTMFFGAMQATRAKLVLIKGDGLDGVSFTLAGDEHFAGREQGELLFDEDPFLSPVHADFFYRDHKLIVRDEDSVNGVYLRIRGAHDIAFGDRFLVGEQLLEVQKSPEVADEPREDGTYFFASPRRSSPFRLLQLLRGGETGMAFRGDGDVVSIGREGNDIDFPDDPFISGRHAQVTRSKNQLVLTDLDSKNGTFVRINTEQVLEHGDYVFMGQQLLRVEIV